MAGQDLSKSANSSRTKCLGRDEPEVRRMLLGDHFEQVLQLFVISHMISGCGNTDRTLAGHLKQPRHGCSYGGALPTTARE